MSLLQAFRCLVVESGKARKAETGGLLCALPLRIIKVRIEMLAAVLEVVSDIDRLTHGGQGPLTPARKGGERGPCVSS